VDVLQKYRGHTMSQTHKNHGVFYFNMRTEFVLMDVRKWIRFADYLKPRPLNNAAEVVVHQCVRSMGGEIVSCPLITPERHKVHQGVYWYQQPDAATAYEELAKKYNVDLGQGFHIGGSHLSPNYRVG
jgi:hypothetical protein